MVVIATVPCAGADRADCPSTLTESRAMTLVADLLASLYLLAAAAADALFGRKRRRYRAAVDIDAPVDVVWRACSAHEIEFDGPQMIGIKVAPRPGTPDIYEGHITVGERAIEMAYREVESRPNEALLIEILKDGSAPSVAPGRDHYVACTFEQRGEGTRLTMVHELTHETFWSRVLIPLGARINGRRLKRYCEKEAGTAKPSSRFGAALMTGALTYASFSYLFNWQFAAVLLFLLIVHEGGHAIAMRWVGLPVQGVYFIPFVGGVAVSAARHRNEGERGFVALMGPGFSVLTTGAFVAGAFMTEDPMFELLALASAMLNGINLAPVLPLDGGQIVDAALSRSDPEISSVINMLTLIAGVGVSVYLEWYVLTAILLLTTPMVFRPAASRRRAEPITEASRNWLVAGYLATVAFYVTVAAHYLV